MFKKLIGSIILINFTGYAFALEIQAHRGARWVRPENTIAAFEYSLQIGVDTLELDTLVTKDGKIVVYHDPYLNSDICLDKEGKKIKTKMAINSLTLDELKTFDCGTLINPKFPEQIPQKREAIPTLEEVLLLVKNSKHPKAKDVRLNVEAKSEESNPEVTPSPKEFVRLIIDDIKKYGFLNRTIFQSFDQRCLKEARKREPSLTLSLLLEKRPSSKEKFIQLVEENDVQILSPRFNWLKVEDVTLMHKKGLQVIPWTPNASSEWQDLIEKGVDGIITDNPKALMDYLDKNTTNIIDDKNTSL